MTTAQGLSNIVSNESISVCICSCSDVDKTLILHTGPEKIVWSQSKTLDVSSYTKLCFHFSCAPFVTN